MSDRPSIPAEEAFRAHAGLETNTELDAQVLVFDAQQGQRVIQGVYDFLGRFVAYPSEHARCGACAVDHPHPPDGRLGFTPRIAFLSAEPASGKTRALEVTELLVPNPVRAVNVSPAYLFRKVGCEEGATILFDEIDTVFGPKAKENEDIRGLLNAGHRRGAVAGRCVVRGKEIVTEEIPAYAAVALAGLGWLPDTILSRSVIIRMRRRHQASSVEPFRRRIHEAKAARCPRSDRGLGASERAEHRPGPTSRRDRGPGRRRVGAADRRRRRRRRDWPRRARDAAVALVAEAKDREPSLGMRLLTDLRWRSATPTR